MKKILAIESSCDETSAAVLTFHKNEIKVLSNITATSLSIHAGTGGIIPENASRMQVKYIIPVIVKALIKTNSNLTIQQFNNSDDRTEMDLSISQTKLEQARIILNNEIDAIAVTYGPGLIGSLLVGVETAKTLSFIFNKPLIPVNHLLAHIYANFISTTTTYNLKPKTFPFIGLIVSGGHTDILYFENHEKFEWLGGTRDDAAGEALDKIGRLLDLPYPAGPEIERRSNLFLKTKNKPVVKFKSPIINSNDFDFSFSGLKTEVLRYAQKNTDMNDDLKNEICFATQKAIIDVLVKKTLKTAGKYGVQTILLGGGVSANKTLFESFQSSIINHKSSIKVFSPENTFCTDNAAMIGAYAFLNPKEIPWQKVNANPELYFD